MTLVAHGAISVIVGLMMLFIFCVHTTIMEERNNKLLFLKIAIIYSVIYLFLISLLPFIFLDYFSNIPFYFLLWVWIKFGIQAMLNENFFEEEPLPPELEKRINSRKHL